MHFPSASFLSKLSLLALSLYSTSTSALPVPRDEAGIAPDSANAAPAAIGQDFPDPSFLQVGNTYYAFATSSAGHHIQVAKSSAFSSSGWSVLNQDALPNPGSWTDGSYNTWAPYVFQLPNGGFVMYYAAPSSQDTSKHCIGTATASSVTGPYTPSSQPWVCPLSQGGAIDPAFFKDPKSGNSYIVYKVDGNSLNGDGTTHSTPILLQQVNTNDGVSKIGNPVQILDRNASDGPLVEAPGLMYANGQYFLIFSSNYYNTDAYDLRYVSASTITGPYSSTQSTLLKTGDGRGVTAPGSGDIHSNGQLVFHGTVAAGPVRDMYAGKVSASGSTLTFTGFA